MGFFNNKKQWNELVNYIKKKGDFEMKENLGTVLAGCGTAILSFFAPLMVIVYVLIFVICLDLLTAIIKALINFQPTALKGWLKFIQRFTIINSRGFLRSSLKLCLYILFVMGIYSAEMAIFDRSIYITNFAAFFLIFGELISIAENLDICLKTNLFTSLIKKVRKMFEKKIVEQITTDKTNNI